ncbi:hypothetical protein [Roseomonas sp. BN140053]|uniref:hypothetical protein n=1 Tax=Roseomonas sp. BN140053 TaxID=3391898 RepID=UPI0039EB761D
MKGLLAVAAGAVLLLWPCALNGYPLVFIDTASYLWQTVVPQMTWDKTYVYGPFLHLGHWRWSLWPSAAMQGLLLSTLLWLAGRVVLGRVSAGLHLLTCIALAALTSLPWFAATLMPDALTGAVTLCLFLLGFGWDRLSRAERLAVVALGTLCIAAHLSHLIQAIAVLALVLLLTRRLRPTLRAAAPLLGALALILATNAVGHGRVSLSPYGSAFLLARLQEDGTATQTLRERCPEAGWLLCGQLAALPADSDWFLWAPESPVNRDPDGTERVMGAARLAPEASAIIAATLRDQPLAVLWDSLRNGVAQLSKAEVGDTLGSLYLDVSARIWIREGFPAAELARYEAGTQARGLLPARATPFLWPHVPVLLLSVPLVLLAWWHAARRGDARRLGFVLCALVGLSANALATGALSKPHHRYEARIIWLLPLAAAWGLLRRPETTEKQ